MPFRNFAWLETSKEGCIPLFISTIFHTSLILAVALCNSVEFKPTQPAFSATFGNEQTELTELDSFELSNWKPEVPKEADPDEPASFGNQNAIVARQPIALSDMQVSMQLTSGKVPDNTLKIAPIERSSNRESVGRKPKVTPVSTSIRSTSFGKRSDFGSRQIVPGPGTTLEVVVPGLDPLGTRVLSQAGNLSLTGGAMMVSTACPAPALAETPLQFSYDASKADGRRLVVIAGKQTATLSMYDWELQPLAKFVDSGHNGAVSIQMLGNQERVSLDAAFEQTLLGLRFIQADLMPRGIIMSQDFLPQDERGIIVGPGEQERLSSDWEVHSAANELKPLMQKTRNGASYSVLTDASVRFVFEIDDCELVVSGTPYFFFWERAKQGAQVVPKKALNEALKQAWPQIKKANPLVIESMERCFRTVALFRFQEQKSPANWRSFVQQVSKAALVPVATPAFLTN